MESDDAIRPRDRGHQSGFEEPLEIDCEIEAVCAQIAPGREQYRRAITAHQSQVIDEGVPFEQRRPARLHGPGEVRASIAVFQGCRSG